LQSARNVDPTLIKEMSGEDESGDEGD